MADRTKLYDIIINTRMQKSYKMPLLLALPKDGDLRQEISVIEVARFFRIIYAKEPYCKDLSEVSNKDLIRWDLKKISAFVIRNPINHIVDHSGGLLYFESGYFGIDPLCFGTLPFHKRARDFEYYVSARLESYFKNKYGYTGEIPLF